MHWPHLSSKKSERSYYDRKALTWPCSSLFKHPAAYWNYSQSSSSNSSPGCISVHFWARSDSTSSSPLCWGCSSSASQSTPLSVLVWQTERDCETAEIFKITLPYGKIYYITNTLLFKCNNTNTIRAVSLRRLFGRPTCFSQACCAPPSSLPCRSTNEKVWCDKYKNQIKKIFKKSIKEVFFPLLLVTARTICCACPFKVEKTWHTRIVTASLIIKFCSIIPI